MSDNNNILNAKSKIPNQIKNYKIEQLLYTQSNAQFYVATNLNINEKVLIKIYEKKLILQSNIELSLINKEVFSLKLCYHQNILKLYEYIESPSFIFLIMEYFNGKKLSEVIKLKKKLNEDDTFKIFKQILSVLFYLQEINCAHLNLNYDNILIDNFNNIKITDFKYSVFFPQDKKIHIDFIGFDCLHLYIFTVSCSLRCDISRNC